MPCLNVSFTAKVSSRWRARNAKRRHRSACYCVTTLCVCSQFDWLAFIKRVVESRDEPARSVSSSEHVIVRAPAYFKELFKLIGSTDAR